MKSALLGILLAGAAAVFLAGIGVFYIMDETEQGIVTRFGRPVGDPITEPGLYFKLPDFVDTINRFDRRWLSWDGAPNQIPTKDKKFIWLDTVARWRITDPLKFFLAVRNMSGAINRLNDNIDGATRDQVANSNLIDLVRSSTRPFTITTSYRESHEDLERWSVGREIVLQNILEQANQNTSDFGVEIRDVRIKHINYVEEVREKVYERMIAERKRIAEKFRSEGEGERQKIEGEIEKELKTILSDARRQAATIQGEADAEATKIYAGAYNRDPEFYSFLKSLESYRKTLKGKTRILQTTDTEYFKYLKRR